MVLIYKPKFKKGFNLIRFVDLISLPVLFLGNDYYIWTIAFFAHIESTNWHKILDKQQHFECI